MSQLGLIDLSIKSSVAQQKLRHAIKKMTPNKRSVCAFHCIVLIPVISRLQCTIIMLLFLLKLCCSLFWS